MDQTQQTFEWTKHKDEQLPKAQCADDALHATDREQPSDEQVLAEHCRLPPIGATGHLQADNWMPQTATPLPDAVAHGIFGWTTEGPIEPDEEEVLAITTEHSYELRALLIELQAVQDAARTGCDPRTGRPPRNGEAAEQLRERCESDERRLKQAYSDAIAVFAEAFGQKAADELDRWVRAQVAGSCDPPDAYDPTHPWHYLPQGDGALPVPMNQIPTDEDAGGFLENSLPKNPKKRLERIRQMLGEEREHLAADKLRYVEVVERGANALSRYDREIAYANDEIAVACTLALKYRHISLGLGRIAWLEQQIEKDAAGKLFTEAELPHAHHDS